jgi:hypothetical protein
MKFIPPPPIESNVKCSYCTPFYKHPFPRIFHLFLFFSPFPLLLSPLNSSSKTDNIPRAYLIYQYLQNLAIFQLIHPVGRSVTSAKLRIFTQSRFLTYVDRGGTKSVLALFCPSTFGPFNAFVLKFEAGSASAAHKFLCESTNTKSGTLQ